MQFLNTLREIKKISLCSINLFSSKFYKKSESKIKFPPFHFRTAIALPPCKKKKKKKFDDDFIIMPPLP